MPPSNTRPGLLAALLHALSTSRDRIVRDWARALAEHGERAASDGARATTGEAAARAAAEK